jgi:1-acyl-sn-glycerol-3-phosphate acyltransferase
MIERPSLLALRVFELFFLPWMRRRIDVRITGLPADLDAGLPLILAANHVSWWDGFALREVHRLLRPAAPLRVLMTEQELSRNRILAWIAAIPLRPGSLSSVRRVFRSLRRLRRQRPDAVVLFFPQGRIWPSTRRPLGFERGIGTLARVLSPAFVVPIALHIEPLAGLRPTMFVAVGQPMRVPAGHGVDALRLENSVEAQADSICAFLSRYGEEASDAWPAPFHRLPDAALAATPVRPHRRSLHVVASRRWRFSPGEGA